MSTPVEESVATESVGIDGEAQPSFDAGKADAPVPVAQPSDEGMSIVKKNNTEASNAKKSRGDSAPKPSGEFIRRRHERMRERRIFNAKEEAKTAANNDNSEEDTKTDSAKTQASSTAMRSFRQLRAKRKARVPGGAAAKLIGKAESDEAETENTTDEYTANDEPIEVDVPTDEFIRMRDEAKAAFTTGTKENRRYHHQQEETTQSSSLPVGESKDGDDETVVANNAKVFNDSQVFHENPTAAVLSLLRDGKKSSPTDGKIPDSVGGTENNNTSLKAETSKDFTQAPPSAGGSIVPSEDLQTDINGNNPLEQPLLSKRAEQRVAQMKEQMLEPNQTLSDLIATIATPEDRDGEFSRGQMVRRKNACGALQVLTGKSASRVKICWTVGILPAISSVLRDSGDKPLPEVIPDRDARCEFVEARKRAVLALLNLSIPPENRMVVFHTPKLVANLVRVIKRDHDEARKGCCAILAHLAKTKENRLLMVQVPGLVDVITGVIDPKSLTLPKTYSDDDDESSTTGLDRPLESTSTNGSIRRYDTGDSYTSAEEKTDDDRSIASGRAENSMKASRRYDEYPNDHLHIARVNIFALVTHLLKEKDNAYILARHKNLVDALVAISMLQQSRAQHHAIKLLAHLTRHRGNSKHIVFKLRSIVPALVKTSFSQDDESRKYSCFALQNLTQDKPCRQELAITEGLLTALCVRIRQASDIEERLAAMHALKNLTDEPANLIPMTNTSECFATLMQIAHASDDSVTEMMQYLGCDALATLSHWFRSIATSGQRIDFNQRRVKPPKELFVPTLKIVTYKQWQ